MNAPTNERARAVRILLAVLEDGRTTDQAFGSADSPLTQELVYGVLRYYYSLAEAVDACLDRALRRKDRDLRLLMLVGAYQLHKTRIPAHAAINETVNACRPLRKPWASGLINGVLRSLQRAPVGGDNSLTTDRSVELPGWIYEKLEQSLGALAPEVARALLKRAPMALRVNALRVEPADYNARLHARNIPAQEGPFPESIILLDPRSSDELPGYDSGEITIQDSGAQHAAHFITGPNNQAPKRILDACAAPGGKLFHLSERFPSADLVALEQSAKRLAHLEGERARLGHQHVRLLEADAREPTWWDGQPFDAILLDAPCTGVGTLRRHPDIKHLRKPEDLDAYVATQGALLRNLWRVLAPGGNLLYCTCSLFQEENDSVVSQFLEETADAVIERLEQPGARPTAHGLMLLPSAAADSPDGFYYARLAKRPAGSSP